MISNNTKLIATLLATTVFTGCSSVPLSTPFKVISPIEKQQDSLVLVVTRAELKNDGKSSKLFNQHVKRIRQNIDNQKGLYGYSLRRELFGNTAWTMTLWKDENAIKNFKTSPFHLAAMTDANTILASASFAMITVDSQQLSLNWTSVLPLLEDGKTYTF